MQCLNERSVCTYQRVFLRETTQKVMSWNPRKVRHCMFCETLMSFWDTLPSSTPSRPPTTTPSKATGRGGEIQLARTDGGHWWLTIHCHTVMVWVIRCPNGGYEGSITLSGGKFITEWQSSNPIKSLGKSSMEILPSTPNQIFSNDIKINPPSLTQPNLLVGKSHQVFWVGLPCWSF